MRKQALTRPRVLHLCGRFFESLRGREPSREQHVWLTGVLTPEELAMFDSMPVVDRTEGLSVARRALDFLPAVSRPDTVWSAAALLHDAGKSRSGLGTAGRVAATMAGAVLSDARLTGWSGSGGKRSRIATYLAHPRHGAELLEGGGARPQVAAWARAHHEPAAWPTLGFPEGVPEALARADGEVVTGFSSL